MKHYKAPIIEERLLPSGSSKVSPEIDKSELILGKMMQQHFGLNNNSKVILTSDSPIDLLLTIFRKINKKRVYLLDCNSRILKPLMGTDEVINIDKYRFRSPVLITGCKNFYVGILVRISVTSLSKENFNIMQSKFLQCSKIVLADKDQELFDPPSYLEDSFNVSQVMIKSHGIIRYPHVRCGVFGS